MKTIIMDKQPTAAELFRVELECTKAEVLDVVNVSENELTDLFLDSATEFLKAMGCDAAIREAFFSTPEFWGMWKKTWYDADREFLQHYYTWGYYNTLHWYTWFHSPTLAAKQKPVNAAYHSLIKTLAVKR